jgi:DnaK suppressor protein
MDLDLATYERRLRDELQSVAKSLERAIDSAAPVELDQTNIGRVSRIDAIQQQAMAMDFRNRLQQRKRRLEAAFNRIGSGDFGLCCECQDELDTERLDADPATVFCIACLGRREAG